MLLFPRVDAEKLKLENKIVANGGLTEVMLQLTVMV
jgi:hypothetical protein